MKIEITNEENGFNIYLEKSQRPEVNRRTSFLSKYLFFDDDIYNLLGEKKFKDFENGKYIFEVSKKHLTLITGQRGAENKTELLMYKD